MGKINDEILEYELELGLKEKVILDEDECDKCEELFSAGMDLPSGVHRFQYKSYYTIRDNGISDPEANRRIIIQQTKYIKTIRDCNIFFTSLIVAGIMFYIIMFLKQI